MGQLVIGSAALAHHYPGETRPPKDFDTIGDVSTTTENFWDPSFSGWIKPETSRVATPDELYTIKISHSYWEINGTWDKHAGDILFLAGKGAKLIPALHTMLYRVWTQHHGDKKKMDLSKESNSFFNDAVHRIYDHDSIHDSVAYFDVPLYTRILRDGASVDIDPKKLWEELTYTEQVLLFREEINATALERLVIPCKYRISGGRAYRWALRRTVTSLTKGRSATFIMDNLISFWTPDDYVTRHKSRLDKLIPLGENSVSM